MRLFYAFCPFRRRHRAFAASFLPAHAVHARRTEKRRCTRCAPASVFCRSPIGAISHDFHRGSRKGGLPAPGENKNAVQDKPTQRSSRTPDAQAEMEQTRNLFLVKKGGIAYNIPCGAVSGRCVGAYSPAQAYGRWNARKLPHFCFPNKLYQAPAVNASRFSASGAQPAHAAACIRGVFSIPAGFFRAKRVY